MSYKEELFDGKTLSDVFSDVYKNTDTKRKQINAVVVKLLEMVSDPNSATIFAPIIREYMDVSVKNDEHIVRLAQIAQRLVSTTSKEGDFDGILSEEEKSSLLKDIHIEYENLKKDSDITENVALPPLNDK